MKENDYPGIFIVIEGPDGAGTTTQSKKLAEELDAFWTSEPTSGEVGEKVEEMIRSDNYSAESIALAFAADRMLHLEEEVVERLKKGEIVVCDRYYHSSLVYQPAFGADYSWVDGLNESALRPDLTVILDIGSQEAFSRLKDRESEKINPEHFEEGNQASLEMFGLDSEVVFEEKDFQKEVIHRYGELEKKLDEKISYVDASPSIEEVFTEMMNVVKDEVA